MDGHGTDEELLHARERGRKLKPDLVLLGTAPDDPRNDTTVHPIRRSFDEPDLFSRSKLIVHVGIAIAKADRESSEVERELIDDVCEAAGIEGLDTPGLVGLSPRAAH